MDKLGPKICIHIKLYLQRWTLLNPDVWFRTQKPEGSNPFRKSSPNWVLDQNNLFTILMDLFST